jgi:hypothetical protein
MTAKPDDSPVPYRSAASLPEPSKEERARRALASHLLGEEQLVWVGWPPGGWRFTAYDVVLVPFSLMWGGFALFWEWMVLSHGAPLFFCLWGVPFVVMGQYVIWGRFLVDAWRRRRTTYALTDSRALIVVDGRSPRITSLDLAGRSDVELIEGRGGAGTIRFGAPSLFQIPGWPGARPGPPAFEHVENARDVYRKLLELVRRRRA